MTLQSNVRRRLVLAAALTLPFGHAFAQAGKPLRMIVPNAAGSSVDALTRIVSVPLSKALDQPVVVENLPGAGGVPATGQLVRAPKDGNTLAMVSNNHVVNPSLYKSMPFDALKDVTPIAIVGGSPFVLVAHPSLGVKTLKELTALAKAKPGKVTIGSSGNGTILHLASEELQYEAGISLKHVPYKGTGQMTTDLLGGQIQLAFLGVTGAVQHVKAGKLVPVGLSTPAPSPLMPSAVPFAEQGLPGYDMQGWIALIGPAGLPPAVVSRTASSVKALLGTQAVQEALTAQGFTATGSTPEEAAARFQADMAKYAKLVRQSGMTID